MLTTRRVSVNAAYTPQQITGQQRYAREIASRLADDVDSFAVLPPSGFWTTSKLRTWAWVQIVLPWLARRSTVLSMTSRAPLWRRRHVLVVHDLFVLSNPEWFSRRYVWTHAPLLRAQIRSAAAVVAVSRPTADQLARYRSDPIEVAPNAPSDLFREPFASTLDDGALTSRGLRPDGYFLTVGSRDPRKNLVRLAEAYGGLDEDERRRFPLVVVGATNAIFRGEQVSWPTGTIDVGYVADEELRVLYRHARSTVFVSLAEGFGLPIVEAAAAGTPSLVVSNIDVFRWICGDSVRYVDPSSVEDIMKALRGETEAPYRQEVDLDRFDWDASAAVVSAVCRRISDRV